MESPEQTPGIVEQIAEKHGVVIKPNGHDPAPAEAADGEFTTAAIIAAEQELLVSLAVIVCRAEALTRRDLLSVANGFLAAAERETDSFERDVKALKSAFWKHVANSLARASDAA